MKWLKLLLLVMWSAEVLAEDAPSSSLPASDTPQVILVVGAEGQSEYGEQFRKQAAQWTNACVRAGATYQLIGTDTNASGSDLDRLHHCISESPTNGLSALWIVLIGHGTWDGHEARFNLRGPDCTATNLAQWLKAFQRPIAVINTASASAPWIPVLAGPRRVVISATRSGDEQNLTRFGGFLAEAVADPSGDLDQDGQTSLLEAFLRASTRTAEWYQTAGRLATEHALIDDNGDGLGTPAAWFRGTRATRKAAEGARLDGAAARQFVLVRGEWDQRLSPADRAKRDALELDLSRLRERRPEPPDEAYYRQIEAIALELARLQVEKAP